MGMARWIKSLLCKADSLSSDLQTHGKLEEVAQAWAIPVHTYREMGGKDRRVTHQNPGRQLDRHTPQRATRDLCPPDGRRGPTLEVLCPSMWWSNGGGVWGFLLRIGPVYPGQSHTTGGEGADSGGCPCAVAPALLPAI